jgi:hypothetical protein
MDELPRPIRGGADFDAEAGRLVPGGGLNDGPGEVFARCGLVRGGALEELAGTARVGSCCLIAIPPGRVIRCLFDELIDSWGFRQALSEAGRVVSRNAFEYEQTFLPRIDELVD